MMYDPRPFMSAAAAWQNATIAYSQMWVAAYEVIWRRSIDMALGRQTAAETTRMFFEKPVAFARAFEKAALAGVKQKGPAGTTLAAIKPIKNKAASNARRLRRRKSRR